MGEKLWIVGFPGIGGETMTVTQGIVSGKTQGTPRFPGEWIKTDAIISPGNSGGAAFDQLGNLVGAPTWGSSSEQGGSIGRIRPVEKADDLIAKARRSN